MLHYSTSLFIEVTSKLFILSITAALLGFQVLLLLISYTSQQVIFTASLLLAYYYYYYYYHAADSYSTVYCNNSICVSRIVLPGYG